MTAEVWLRRLLAQADPAPWQLNAGSIEGEEVSDVSSAETDFLIQDVDKSNGESIVALRNTADALLSVVSIARQVERYLSTDHQSRLREQGQALRKVLAALDTLVPTPTPTEEP